jgi:hypothetical protein
MTKNATPRLIQNEITECLILRDPLRLVPDGLAGRRLDTANDYISYFSFRVAADNLNSTIRSYGHSGLHIEFLI